MKRITLYSDELDKNDVCRADFPLLPKLGIYRTRGEQKEHLEKLWIQREEYQKKNRIFLSDERKNAWMR